MIKECPLEGGKAKKDSEYTIGIDEGGNLFHTHSFHGGTTLAMSSINSHGSITVEDSVEIKDRATGQYYKLYIEHGQLKVELS